MRKIAMVIVMLSALATSANAGYWTHTPNGRQGGNWTSYAIHY